MRNKRLFSRKYNEPVNGNIGKEMEFEDALDLAGMGRYQYFHVVLMCATLAAALSEIIGYAFLIPALACDLHLPDSLRGLIASIPNIGIIISAPFWGRMSDRYGRRSVLILSSAVSGCISLLAAFMPDLISFSVCKLIGALFISCPSSLGFAYAGEMVPRRRRDLAVIVCNGMLSLSTMYNPLLAWLILSFNWKFQMGAILMRPWRLLTVGYAFPLLLTAAWVTQAKESPKFLMAKGKKEQALQVLRHIYVKNTGRPVETFSVTSLKCEECLELEVDEAKGNNSALALIRPPHLKWFSLTAFLMFGLYTILNGLYLFSTGTINTVLNDPPEDEGNICTILNKPVNQTIDYQAKECDDSISQAVFIIMTVTTLVYCLVILAACFLPVTKKTLLVIMFATSGTACLLTGVLTNRVVAAVLMSGLQLASLGIGPLTAYTVEMFPTTLRGTAVGAVLMFGRAGAVVGATLSGWLLVVACSATFYGFAALIYVCAGLSFLLPKSEKTKITNGDITDTENSNR